LAKMRGEGADEAPCREANRKRYGAEQQMLLCADCGFSVSLLSTGAMCEL